MLKRAIDYAVGGRLEETSIEKAWSTIEELAQYKEEGWNDPIFQEEGSPNYKNASIEQTLRIMESQVDSLRKDAVSLIGKSENLCGMSNNDLGCFPPKPSHREAFEGLLMNFLLEQEEKVRQLEEYMGAIRSDFMQLSLELVKKLKEEIRIKENKKSSPQGSTRNGLRIGETIKAEHVLMGFWPTIGDGEFVVGGMAVKKTRDPRVRLAHRLLSLGAHVFRKKSLLAMDVIMELANGACYRPVTRQVGEDYEVEEAANEGAGGSDDMYQNMSQAFGKLLEDIHVTWTHLGKKRDKIAALQRSGFKNCSQSLETASQFPSDAVRSYKRRRQKNYDGVRT
ncbi:hypothetical protein Tco_0713331 [Tanacetum coccineum]